MKNLSIIVAIAEDLGIGKNNKLLAHIPGDLPRFKKITSGHTVIMGRNTYLSLPHRPLKDRRNIVISDKSYDSFDGCITVNSIGDALAQCESERENFVIGGASVYRQCMPHASRLYLTIMHRKFDADTFFPEISPMEWTEVSREIPPESASSEFAFEYVIMQRKS